MFMNNLEAIRMTAESHDLESFCLRIYDGEDGQNTDSPCSNLRSSEYSVFMAKETL